MVFEPLDAIPLGIFFAAATVMALVGLEAGYQIGRWRHNHAVGEKEAPIGAMVGAILGLLAFMLAFTFSLAASRFDARRTTILNEANAIGTTYLRARLLPEPQRSETAKLLREYVDIRIRAVQEGTITETVQRSEELHEKIWDQAVAAAEKHSDSVLTGVYIQSLNEMIDLHATRLLVGARSRIPITIWIGLFSLAFVGMASMGYQAGLSATRRSPAMLFLAVSFAGVLYLIVDLDRPHQGMLKVGQQAMIDLQHTMQPDEK
ncbi:MAG: hypothetical protein AB7O26_16795 [Planctomycetaceae bacterium]